MSIIFINLNGILKRESHSISICVHLNNESCSPPINSLDSLHSDMDMMGQPYTIKTGEGCDKPCRAPQVEVSRLSNRLRSSDRLVLIALRSRVPEGTSITQLVRVRELMEECSISRKQVQICLKRLSEKKMISRITKGVIVGSQEGYRYRILRGIGRSSSKENRLPNSNR